MADDGSSSESDDEFLTVGNKSKGKVDREALIRKKLLESFYGQTGAASPTNAAQPRRTSSSKIEGNRNAGHARGSAADAKDLDSPYFDVDNHTKSHVVGSTVHDLLEMDEQLTLQVRTLDSTTQNMVYENYSKFIDGTAAISSVGVNVQANEQGLERLLTGMATINEKSKSVEDELGSLRDAVAEKIRVKRLLTRLDALLKLPATLREQIAAGNYRQAASSFCRSTTILSKHSEGFESLQKIETECNAILLDMVKDMKRKLRHWSGQDNSVPMLDTMSEDNEGTLKAGSFDSLDESENLYEPPKSIADIFECAATLVLLMKERPIADLDPGVTLADCERMSIVAATRLLERMLDTHQLEVQEAAMDASVLATSVEEGADFERPAFHLIPTHVLDGGILQTAALFRRSFKDDKDIHAIDFGDGPDHLEAFVEDAFASFLYHVKSVLLEHTMGTQTSQESQNGGQEADGNEGYVDIAAAMSTLLVSVRELASALSLPEIGIRPDVASGLVEQAADLSDTLVRGRVDRLLCELRLRVVNDCLGPLAERIVADKDEDSDASVMLPRIMTQVVQIAVSDCMQLLDDTIRSIVSGRDDLGASIDLPALKQSIQASTSRFASWLAGSLEVLAGCDSSDPYFSFEASVPCLAPGDSGAPGVVPSGLFKEGNEDVGELSGQFETLNAKVDDALQGVATALNRKSAALKSYDVVLQLFEMCRNCESSIVDAMRQSIETKVGGGKKGRSSGLFPIDKKNVALSPHEKSSAVRFRLAGSRILGLYCGNRGFDAAHHLCIAAHESESEQFPDGPSAGACLALDIAKQVSVDCSKLFRDEKPLGPLPDFSSVSAMSQPMLGRITSPVKGLQLDVERMFQEKISIYPHPSEDLEFSRDAVLTLFFFVMIKAAAEQARQRSFSATGYLRLLVDMEFLREMIPCYVNEKYEAHGSKACTALSSQCNDTVNNARDRCQDQDLPGNDMLIRRAREALKGYMMTRDAEQSFTLTG